MSNKLRIAICVSGQTRHFNKDPLYTEHFNEMLGLFNEYDYDLFGHTWADQEDPHPEVLDKFTAYRSDPQSIIWDNITKVAETNNLHWDSFFTTRDQWMEKPEYLDILSGKSDVSFIDFAKERIHGALGQIWSAHESFLLMPSTNEYDFVVRLRWDMMFNFYHGHEWVQYSIDRFKEQLYNWSHRHKHWNKLTSNKYPSCLCLDDCILTERNIPYFNDHLFVFKNDIHMHKILQTSPYDLFAHMLKKLNSDQHPCSVPQLGSAHTLWVNWILNAGFAVSPVLPNIFQANGPSEGKVNKPWSN